MHRLRGREREAFVARVLRGVIRVMSRGAGQEPVRAVGGDGDGVGLVKN